MDRPTRPAPPRPSCPSSSHGSTAAATSGSTTRRCTSSSTSGCSRGTPPTPSPASPTGSSRCCRGWSTTPAPRACGAASSSACVTAPGWATSRSTWRSQLQQEAGHDQRAGKTRMVKGRPGVYNVIYGYTDEEVAVAAGQLAVRLVNHLVQPEDGFRLPGRARAVPHPRRAHGVRAVDRRDRRGGGQPRHPLHPAQQRQPRPAGPGRAPAAHPRDDDVEDRGAGRRHRRRQGHDRQAARFGRAPGAAARRRCGRPRGGGRGPTGSASPSSSSRSTATTGAGSAST